jgi:hypothetical protein
VEIEQGRNEVGELATSRVLRRLFLTLFLRGRGARGLQKDKAPKSVGSKMWGTLALYLLIGMVAFAMWGKPVFGLAIYLHAMTFVFLGMFVAASAGEILFNRDEAEILLHRPIEPRVLLWAKIRVLAEVSLWLAVAFNLAGMVTGIFSPDGGWRFPLVHLVATGFEALFCTGLVVVIYQLCLRWFGRERVEGMMTAAQMLVAIGAVLAGQVLPRVMFLDRDFIGISPKTWWTVLLPPAWFAGMDDALGGSGAWSSWALGFCGVAGTGIVLAMAVGRLARSYEMGLQTFNEAKAQTKRLGRRWIDRMVRAWPLSWWLRDPVQRAGFLLTTAYLARDRDVKLRVYPGIAPMLVVPAIFLFNEHEGHSGGFGIAFVGAYAGLVPALGVGLLQYSSQWQAADLFRAAPLAGPGALCHGSRKAVMLWLTFPLVVMAVVTAWLVSSDVSELGLLAPGLVALPLYALVPNLGGKAVPLSAPGEEAKSASRGVMMIAAMVVSVFISLLGLGAWKLGVLWWFVGVEVMVAAGLYVLMWWGVDRARWGAME